MALQWFFDNDEFLYDACGFQDATSKPPELITAGNQPVLIKAAPLHLEEVYNGSTNASNASGAVDGADGAIRTFRNGSESKAESGGLFKWLKPGEPLKLPENVKLPEGLPQLLITIAPELFGFATPSHVPTERVNVTGKAKVEEITATPQPDASSVSYCRKCIFTLNITTSLLGFQLTLNQNEC